jgi:general secretion pathway protein I
MSTQRGFTLLEVIIALIIASLAAAALLAAVGTGLSATRTASMVDQALVRAKSHLAAATHGARLVPGETSGDDGGGFRWRQRVAVVASTTLRPVGMIGPRAAASIPVSLYAVSVSISWSDGGTERQVRLDTEQVGG